jgi:hypothetical protein
MKMDTRPTRTYSYDFRLPALGLEIHIELDKSSETVVFELIDVSTREMFYKLESDRIIYPDESHSSINSWTHPPRPSPPIDYQDVRGAQFPPIKPGSDPNTP